MKVGHLCSLCRGVSTWVEERVHRPTGRVVLVCRECLNELGTGERAEDLQFNGKPPLIVRLPFSLEDRNE